MSESDEDGDEHLLRQLLMASELDDLVVASPFSSLVTYLSQCLSDCATRALIPAPWQSVMNKIARLQVDLSPLDQHAEASSALWLVAEAEDPKTTAPLLCLLVMSRALTSYESDMKRLRRWQSLVWETLRAFQRTWVSVGDSEEWRRLWTDHVVPATRHVQHSLNSDSRAQAAWLAGLLSTTSSLAVGSVNRQALLETLISAAGERALDELWSLPVWPEDTASSETLSDANDEMADMETQVDELGLALLAAERFPHASTLSVVDSWHVFAPHARLLLESVEYAVHGEKLLDGLLAVVEDKSLMSGRLTLDEPQSSTAILQLLGNRMIEASVHQDNRLAGEVYRRMQRLLKKHSEVSQVAVAEVLLATCPHDGLRPKLVDLLRGFVTFQSEKAERGVWQLIDAAVRDLEQHMNGASFEQLLADAEYYCAMMGLIELWIMIRRTSPPLDGLGSRLDAIVSVAYACEQSWSKSLVDAPAQHHRLYMLRMTIQQVPARLEQI